MMNTARKLELGSTLAVLGAVGAVFGPQLGATDLGRPWSFVAGLAVGCLLGLGATLSCVGLTERRRAVR